MIIVFEGPMGSGKTLSATAFAVLDWLNSGRQIIANYMINLDAVNVDGEFVKEVKPGDFEYFSYEKFVSDMENNTELFDKTVVLDEAYLFADSRLSQSGLNKLMSYFVLQTRKRGVDLYVATQQFRNVEIRIRLNADVRGLCKWYPDIQICRVRFIDLRRGRRKNIRLYGPEYFPFFDTYEIPPLRPGHTKGVAL